MSKRKNSIFIHVLIPMLIGGGIYIIFRDKNLLMFQWFELIGISDKIDYLRLYFSDQQMPYWVLFNFADGVWIYSFVSLMLIIWEDANSVYRYYWYILAPILGISAELGQYTNLVPGTFEVNDLIFCLIGSVLPFIFIKFNYYKLLWKE
tara:strand:- start:553 stop:999 length:447 start_codon:yes stop_codon:yes gene_type:complete